MKRRAIAVPVIGIGVEVVVVLVLAIGVSFFCYWFYAAQKSALRLDVHKHLREVVDLKASDVAAWRNDRLGDAAAAITLFQVAPALSAGSLEGAGQGFAKRTSIWLESLRASYHYAFVVTTDIHGKIFVKRGELLGPERLYEDLAVSAISTRSKDFHDVAPGNGVAKPHFVLATELITASGNPIGALLLGIDPALSLYPTVLRWPSVSRTGQVVLLRRDRDSAIFLSDLDGAPGSAMTLRRSLSNRSAVSVKAVLGDKEVDGITSAGDSVFGAARQVPGSDWFVTATMHADEAFEPLSQIRTGLWLIVGLFVLMSVAGIEVIRRRELSKFYRQRYQAEMEKQAILGHYDYLTRYANDAIMLVDEKGAIVEANDRCTDFYGYTREELLRMNIRDMRTPERRASFQDTWNGLVKQNSLVYETENVRKDGRRFPIEVSARIIEVEGKKFAQSIVRDISERRRAEEHIRRLNRLYRVLSACGNAVIQAESEDDLLERVCRIAAELGNFRLAAVGMIDPEAQKIVQMARAGEASEYLDSATMTVSEGPFGMGPAGRSVREGTVAVCNDFSEDPLMAPWNEAAQRYGLRSSISMPLRRGSKVVGQLSLYSSEPRFFNAEEIELAAEIAGSISYALDALERERLRRQAESELRSSRERVEMVLDATNEGYWDWNLVTGAGHQSHRYFTMLGYEPGEIPDGYETWRSRVHPMDLAVADAAAKRVSDQDAFSFEVRVRCKAGNYIWCLCRGKVVGRQEGGLPARLVGTNTDITARKELEEQFLQAQKLESVGRLAGGVAHDFNNLLTVINGYGDLLISRLDSGNPLRAMAEEVRKAGESAASLTQQLLAFSRMQLAEPEPLSLNSVVTESEKMLARLVGEHIEVITALRAKPDRVLADHNQIHQCVLNLAVNARDAMPQGGQLLIETANVEVAASDAAKEPDVRPGSYIMLAVTDTGSGMNGETRRRIFEPFFTTKEKGKGTGLGLSTVYGIVQQCNGFIRVDSEPGRGTSLRLYLPRTEATPAVEPEIASRSHPSGSETILIVEDQENVRGFLTDALLLFGYSVLQAAGGDEALEVAQRHQGPIHLLLTDVIMPGMNGKELARRMKLVRPEMQVLFMSGYTGDTIAHQGALEPGLAFVPKPFTLETLAAKIRELLVVDGANRRSVLIVDDQESIRELFHGLLAKSYRVVLASDGKEALSILQKEQIDLVITDLVMPNGEGLETIQAIRELCPSTRIIAISGAFGGRYLKPAQLLGADATLSKPLAADDLCEAVREVLSRPQESS